MKIYVLSDIHLEFTDFEPPKTDADVIVLAGDIHVGTGGIKWALQTFSDKPVIYVPGNHEYYGSNLQQTLDEIKSLTADTHIHVLEKNQVIINDVEFLGCTLWTDFNLTGQSQSSKNLATRYINDYEVITYGTRKRNLTTRDTTNMHTSSAQWLRKQPRGKASKRVIVTHHAPCQNSLPPVFSAHGLHAAYASNLEKLISEASAELWLHGHIHASSDYVVNGTRIICNPRGYAEGANNQFIDDLIIEI
jgi:Icc-related predicted phosphoesterase